MSSSMIYCPCKFCGTTQRIGTAGTTINSFLTTGESSPNLQLYRNVPTTVTTATSAEALHKTKVMTKEACPRQPEELNFGIEQILYGSSNAELLSGRINVPYPSPHSTNRRSQSLPRSRPVFTDHQRMTLENRFQQQHYLGKRDRYHLSLHLGLTEHQIKVWFQNRRVKYRKAKGQNPRKRRTKLSRGGGSANISLVAGPWTQGTSN